MNQYSEYLKSLYNHISYVSEAFHQLGGAYDQIVKHDLSKFGEEEFTQYANYFYNEDGTLRTSADRTQTIKDDFKQAWLHHLHENPHHWQHWLVPGQEEPNGAVYMPHWYVLEMVADWMGASKAYTGSWDMTKWLGDNLKNVVLHPDSAEILGVILINQGYEPKGLVGYTPWDGGDTNV